MAIEQNTGEQKPVICRVCHAQCGLLVDFENGKPTAIHGDKDNPVYHGYSCIKGREMHTMHTLPSRLKMSQKRMPDGSYADIASAQAIAEVGDKLKDIIAKHGPRSVAIYVGTYGYNNFASNSFGYAFMDAIKSPMIFTSVTIDQPGKGTAAMLHGPWMAGVPWLEEWDALLLVGTNPVVSMLGGLGMNPHRHLHEAKKRGMKLVVIDPRKTDVAQRADIHIAPRAGEDAPVLAAIAKIWLDEGSYDKAFVDDNTQNLDALRAAVAPYTPEYAAERAGVKAEEIIAAARMLAHGRVGGIQAGTGPNMSGRGNLVEYLVKCLTTLRGWWLRAGDERKGGGVLFNPLPTIAATPGPLPAWGFGEKLRVRGLTDTAAGLPTAALADEILMPGEGQVKALICLGGNPMQAWPDQLKTHDAMKALDLLVTIDPRQSGTGRIAHYNLACKLHMEVEGNTALSEFLGSFGPGWGHGQAYGAACPPLLALPPGSDLVEEWEVFYGVAQRMGLTLKVKSAAFLDEEGKEKFATVLDMSQPASAIDAWAVTLNGSPISLDEVRKYPQGHIFDVPKQIIQPRPEGWEGRLELGAKPMLDELADIAASPLNPYEDDNAFPFRIISRRLNDMHNSNWHDSPRLSRKWRYNPIFMNPDDMERLGVGTGEVVEIESARAAIYCVVEAAPDVRSHCAAIPHSFGGNPDEPEDPYVSGGNTGKLSDVEQDYDPYTGIPLMSGIPVRIKKTNRFSAGVAAE
jgi:anaerobic selenocysteine-containing dehydrogenase